ncbi:MAG: NAD(P)/FAD-dependent oxidoreductase [Thermoplasmata archaeon]
MKYDVVVVGAGPGGSSAAKWAAKSGAKVLMIEKRQEIGSPVRCGEGIAKIWLDELGIKPDKKWIANEVKGARIISPNGTILTLTEKLAGNECGYVVERDLFDRELAKDAIRSGADVMVKCAATDVIKEKGKVVGVKAKYMGENFEIRAPIVIGADGFESQVGRWAGIDTSLRPEDINTCFEYVLVGIDGNPDFNDFYLGSIAPGGYIWVFSKGSDSANVGIGVQLSKLNNGGDAKMYLDKFIKSKPGLAKGQPIKAIAGAVSVCAPIDCTVTDGLMLVGDAARQIDPITGGGVANACMAGMIAGKVAGKALQKNDFSKEMLMEYDRGWREEFEDQMYRNFVAKEKLVKLSDETFDKCIEAMQGVDLERITTLEILKAVQAKYPELIKEFEDLLM